MACSPILCRLLEPEHAAVSAVTTFKNSECAAYSVSPQATAWVIGGPNGAAAKLGLKRTTLICKMQKLGICRPVLQSSADLRGPTRPEPAPVPQLH